MMSLEGLDLNLLLVLHHALTERSVVRAAGRLHVTPSAVSNALARLRALLGDPLLVRSGRKLVATPRGAELAPKVAAAVASVRAVFEAQPAFDAASCARAFTIASADNVGMLPDLVARFGRQLPRASLRVVTLDHAVAGDGLRSGEVDVLLGLPPSIPPDCRSEPAYTDRLVCAVWSGNREIGPRLTLAQYLRARHVEVALQGKYAIDYVDTVLSKMGHARRIAVSVPLFTTAALCVIGTSHIAMIPERMALPMAKNLPLRFHEAPFELPAVTVLQVWHARADDDAASVFLRAMIREAGAGKPSPGRRSARCTAPSRKDAGAAVVKAP